MSYSSKIWTNPKRWFPWTKLTAFDGEGPRLVVSTAAFHARPQGSVPGFGGLKETKMFLPHSPVDPQVISEPTLDHPRMIHDLFLSHLWTIPGSLLIIPEPSLDHLRVIQWVTSESTLESCRIIPEPYLNQPWPSQDYSRVIHDPPPPCTVPGSSLSYVWTNSGAYQDNPSVIPKPTLDHPRIIPELTWTN